MSNFSTPLFNPKEVTAYDLLQMLRNGGLLMNFKDFKFAQESNGVVYRGLSSSGKNFMWYVVMEDEEQDDKYLITTIFAHPDANGGMSGDFGGNPDFDDLSYEQVFEKLAELKRVNGLDGQNIKVQMRVVIDVEAIYHPKQCKPADICAALKADIESLLTQQGGKLDIGNGVTLPVTSTVHDASHYVV